MSFSAYPEYIDSGVDRLGEVPAGWTVSPLKRFLIRNDGGVWGDDPDGENETIVLRSTEQAVDGRWQIEEPATRTLNPRERDSALLEVGDLVVTKSSGSSLHIGKTSIVDEAIADLGACYSNFMQRLRVSSDCNPRFVWFVMNNPIARGQFDLFSNSTTGLANLNATILGEVRLAFPSGDEQRKIVNFLDRETGKIDAAVAAQERLIALLAEKRAATISHAVTKGLDPDAPRKDSGIEWLGQIPAHWSVQKIGWKLDAKPRYGVLVPDDDPDGVPMLRIKDLTAEVTDTSSLMTISADLSDQYPNTVVEVGDMLLSVVGTIGSTRIVGPQLAGANLSRALARLRPSDTVYTSYLRWIFQSLPFTQYVDLTCVGTAQRVLNMDDLSALRFAFPTIEEQRKISEELDRAVGRFDDLINRARAAMELLKERRAALISDAVTGKIDVRGEVNAQEQEAA